MRWFRRKKTALPFDSYGNEPQKKYRRLFPVLSPSEKKSLIAASVLLAVVLLIFAVTFILSSRPPHLTAVDPKTVSSGDYLFLSGRHLKSESVFDKIEVAGQWVAETQIKEWTPSQIILRVPPQTNSGLIYVTTRLGKSNGLLFINRDHLPVKPSVPADFKRPSIASPAAVSGYPGALVSLIGERFGNLRLDASLYLQPASDPAGLFPEPLDLFQYEPLLLELWSDREIRFRLPDFPFEGSLLLKTHSAAAPPIPLSVVPVGGSKSLSLVPCSFTDRVVLTPNRQTLKKAHLQFILPQPLASKLRPLSPPKFNHSVRFKSQPGQLWVSAELPKVRQSETSGSFAPYRLETVYRATASCPTVAFAPDQMVAAYEPQSALYQYYAESELSDKETAFFKEEALRFKRGQIHPFGAAKALYRSLVRQMQPASPSSLSLTQAFTDGKGSVFHYAHCLTALYRAAGIPARLAEGFLLNNRSAVRHLWVQFYIQGYGWIDADPWLADSPAFADLPKESTGLSPLDACFGCSGQWRLLSKTGKTLSFPPLPSPSPLRSPAKGVSAIPFCFLGFNGERSLSGLFVGEPGSYQIQHRLSYSPLK